MFDALERELRLLVPQMGDAAITHRWGGAARRAPRTGGRRSGFDRISGLGWAGGYVGDGVATTNLAGRTLADLVLRRDTDLTRLPWVGHRSRHWEPEPFRWLGINAGRAVAGWCRSFRGSHRPGGSGAGPDHGLARVTVEGSRH